MHRWQNDEAFIISPDKAIHWIIFILVVAHLLANARQIKAHRWVWYHHLEAQFGYFDRKRLDLLGCLFLAIVNWQRVLDLECKVDEELICQACFHYLAPVWLICFPEHTLYWSIKLGQTANLVKNLLCRCEMLLDCNHEGWENALVEKDHAFKIELWAKQVKKYVLAVTFVHFRALVRQLVKHGKRLRCVRHARHHLSHAWLKLNHFILELLIFSF